MATRTFRVWRGDKSGGEFKEYQVEIDEGMVFSTSSTASPPA
ncbi:MAG: hypothetical protein U0802_12460 [Candidatus Binatia bacterium]